MKKITTVYIDAELLELAKSRGVNISQTLEEALKAILGGENVSAEMIEAEIAKLKKQKEETEALISFWESQLEKVKKREKDLGWRLKVLRKFLAEKSPHYEDSLRLHAEELGMEVEELRRLVEG